MRKRTHLIPRFGGLIALLFCLYTSPAFGQVVIDSILPGPGCLPGGSFAIFGSGLGNVNSVIVNGTPGSAVISLVTPTAVAGHWNFPGPAGAYTVNVSDGSSNASFSQTFENPNPAFSMEESYCQDEPLSLPVSFANAGSYSCAFLPGNQSCDSLVLDSVTGGIQPQLSAPGQYAVIHTVASSGGCQNSDTAWFEILPVKNVQYFYSRDTFCQADFPEKPLLIGGDSTGSFYSYSLGNPWGSLLFISNIEGLTNFALTFPGTYELFYQVPGYCVAGPGDTVTVIAQDDPTFSYPSDHFCQNEPNSVTIPTINGSPGGYFKELTQSVVFVDSVTGEIDLSASASGGPFPITYHTTGLCPATYTVNLIIYTGSDSCSGITGQNEVRNSGFRIYPNPASSFLQVDYDPHSGSGLRINLISIQGQKMQEWYFPASTQPSMRLELPALPSGMYLLEVQTRSGTFTQKLILNP
ncbi:MAG: T9SS type A sorting domain-containing protein [Bacteroidia bacterium]|nr:T9SS type A sorting domain-containing protein [Bacteroidia bacterium]